MIDPTSTHASAIARFRSLHESGCFLLPNPWDVGTAVSLRQMGFEALATTSAGFAFTRGLPDEVTAISLTQMLEHIRDVVTATPLPVNADFQAGYADEPEKVAANVARCVATGVAGLSIEDATGDGTASVGSALARVAWAAFLRAARSIKETGSFDVLGEAVSFAELNGVFRDRRYPDWHENQAAPSGIPRPPPGGGRPGGR
jgi:2-methylisocitrate lyase-like PEP mutase family enzyme